MNAQHVVRTLLNQPLNSALIVLVLALGMSGVIGMLSIIKTTVWSPAPYPNAADIQNIGSRGELRVDERIDQINASDFLVWRELVESKATLVGVAPSTISLAHEGRAERYDGALVSHELFGLLGVEPALGRDFLPEDDMPGAPLTVIISHELWRDQFGSDLAIVGMQIRANAQSAVIIGVMPPNFAFPAIEKVWMPTRLTQESSTDVDLSLLVFASLKPGASWTSLFASLENWVVQAGRVDPEEWARSEFANQSLGIMHVSEKVRGQLELMLATVVLVLLVACANAANLILARTLSRSRDLALRLTLGASRWQVTQYLLGQSLTLTAVALLIAIPLAHFGIGAVLASFAGTGEGPPPWMDFSIDLTMIVYAGLIAFATALGVGLLPVFRLRTDRLGTAMRDGGRSVTGGGLGKLSQLLVVGELALACVVLLATVVVVRGVERFGQLDLGIDQSNLLTARVALFDEDYPTGAAAFAFSQVLTERLRQHPEVVDATAATTVPGMMASDETMLPEGFDVVPGSTLETRQGAVDSNFASTYKVELRAGRFFDSRDTADSDPVLIVDSGFANQIYPGLDPLGRRVRIPADGEDARWHTIVGVIEPMQLEDVGDREMPISLVSLAQHPAKYMSIAVRTRGDPGSFKSSFQSILREIDADVPAYWLRTFDEVLGVSLAGERVLSRMFSAFGAVALILAAAGLYGLITQLVSDRTREIGVQRALGASAVSVLRGVLGRTMLQVAVGVVLGFAVAVPFARLLVASLPGLTLEIDAILILAVILLMIAVVATIAPARRALTIDPMVALRHE